MVMLIGREYTQRSNQFLAADKEYRATVRLGQTTDTYDIDGRIESTSSIVPSLPEVEQALLSFQGDCQQIPPMFSAKKIGGKKLCDLARKGIEVERKPISIRLATTLIAYEYPHIELHITCSKGTYIRTVAHDLGKLLGCGAILSALTRTRSGLFTLADCVHEEKIYDPSFDIVSLFRQEARL